MSTHIPSLLVRLVRCVLGKGFASSKVVVAPKVGFLPQSLLCSHRLGKCDRRDKDRRKLDRLSCCNRRKSEWLRNLCADNLGRLF